MAVKEKTNAAPIISILSAGLLGLATGIAAFLGRSPERYYSDTDIAAGVLFVFVLSLMIFLLLWPLVLQKYGGSRQ
jgi:hypothetical protein